MYSGDMTWNQWVGAIQNSSNSLLNDINQGKQLADKFNGMTYGLTDPQILALQAFQQRSEADLTNLKYALGVFTDLWNAMNNGAVATANRMGYLEPFV